MEQALFLWASARCGSSSGWGYREPEGLQGLITLPVPTASLQVLQFPQLRQLSLSLLPALTDKALVAVAKGCPSLERLALSHCSLLSDQGWAQAASSWPRLQHLNLSSCSQLTEQLSVSGAAHGGGWLGLGWVRCSLGGFPAELWIPSGRRAGSCGW